MSTLLTPPARTRFLAADLAFTRYNARRSLRLTPAALEVRRLGGAAAVRDTTSDAPYYNRIIGLTHADIGELDAAIAWYREVDRDCAISLTPDPASLAAMAPLARRGFTLFDSHAFFATRPTAAPAPSTGEVSVRRAGEVDLNAVFDLWQAGAPAIEREVRALKAREQLDPRFHIYLASLDDRPVAMATTFCSDGVAWLGNANTLPGWRRRGCQLALLRRRLADASAAGCAWALTDTAFGSASHRNAERAGMPLAFLTYELRRSRDR